MSDRWKLYKKCDDFRVQAPQSVQDIIEIKSIAENGIFEIGMGGVYTKCYTFSDLMDDVRNGNQYLFWTNVVLLFKSDVSANQRLVESLGFTPAQIEYITHEVSPGKGLLRFGQTVVPFDMTLPRESVIYKITDTNAHDKFSMEHTQSSQMNSNGI